MPMSLFKLAKWIFMSLSNQICDSENLHSKNKKTSKFGQNHKSEKKSERNPETDKGAFTYDVRWFLGIFDLPTYPIRYFNKYISKPI